MRPKSGSKSKIFSSRNCASRSSTAPSFPISCATAVSKESCGSASPFSGSPALFAGRSTGNADSAGEPLNGEAEPQLSFETAVAQEMGKDGAVEDREAQLRDENIFDLLPDFGRIGGGVGCFVCHVFIPRRERWWTVRTFEIQCKDSRAALPGELAAPSRGEDLGGRGKKSRTSAVQCWPAKNKKTRWCHAGTRPVELRLLFSKG